MSAWMRSGTVAGLLCLALGATGCSLASLAYFLTPEQKIPAELQPLSSPDNQGKTTVVILASLANRIGVGGELIGVEQDLSERVARQLFELCMANKDRVVIVGPRRVADFKAKHSDWQTMLPAEIGEHFKADYVVNLEIHHLSLYEKSDWNYQELYRGRIEMTVSLIDVHHKDRSPLSRDLSDVQPDESRPVTRDSMNVREFRGQFLDIIARRVAWCFADHPRSKPWEEDHRPFRTLR